MNFNRRYDKVLHTVGLSLAWDLLLEYIYEYESVPRGPGYETYLQSMIESHIGQVWDIPSTACNMYEELKILPTFTKLESMRLYKASREKFTITAKIIFFGTSVKYKP
jgi:hypothetical protein